MWIFKKDKGKEPKNLKRAQEIHAERILYTETIPEKGHLMVVQEIPDDDSPKILDWIQT